MVSILFAATTGEGLKWIREIWVEVSERIQNASPFIHLFGKFRFSEKMVTLDLESTDAAGRVLHPSPKRRDVGRGVWRGWPRVGAASNIYFIFFKIHDDTARFAPTWLDSRRTGLIQPESSLIGHLGPYRPPIQPKQVGNDRNRPKSAVKLARATEILTSDVFLAFFFLCFVN